jgi:hypothetical protein
MERHRVQFETETSNSTPEIFIQRLLQVFDAEEVGTRVPQIPQIVPDPGYFRSFQAETGV